MVVQCDHSDDEQVKNVFEKIRHEQDGRLDILVNNAFAGVPVRYLFLEMEMHLQGCLLC